MTRRALSGGLAVLVVAEAVGAVVLTAMAGWGFREALDAFVISNCVMGVAFGLCGALIAWHRPGNPIGWLFAVGGALQGVSGVAAPLGAVLFDADAPEPVLRLVETVFLGSWPWAIGLCLPLFLILFPNGRPASPAWRWVVLAVVATAPVFVLSSLSAEAPVDGYPGAYLSLGSPDSLGWLWSFGEVRTLGSILLGVMALVVRSRRADEEQRQQILWLLLAALIVAAFITPWSFVAGTPIFVLFAIPLIPVAVAVAIVRHRLLDIRLVVSRVLAWALLSLAVVLAYVALVGLLDQFVSQRLGRSAVATVLVALAVAPVLPRLQRWVDRLMYGDRRDPARIISRLGEGLSGDGLGSVVGSIRAALRFPYVGLRFGDRLVAEDGETSGPTRSVPLSYAGRRIGELAVGLRPGERELSASDLKVLQLVTSPLAVAAELQASRDRLVAAREDERSRLRRDLHDGLGPHLTGVAMKADAARNLVESDPATASAIVTALASDTRAAIAEVRRVVDGLRPAALDELGLVGAIRERAEALAGTVSVRLETPSSLPPLPHSVEVAAYRVATEALNNVVRHAQARAATVRLQAGDRLDVEVVDDGGGRGPWIPGVGLQAMSARATELGGSFEAGPDDQGGRVLASFPLGVA